LIFKIFILILFFYCKPILASEECSIENNLRVGLIDNKFIDYQYYLYYELGNYAQENDIEFKFDIVDKNLDEFDIIFGEFNQLKKLSTKEILLPDQVKRFYKSNGLEISQNILPLDLDTLIILSNEVYTFKNLEELSNLYSPIKYTFGMNFNNNEDLLKLITFTNHQKTINLKSNMVESTLSSFSKLYTNANKNILDANFIELFNSYENKENLFTLFSDGILFYKNLQNSYFNLFPQNNFIWDSDIGKFINSSNSIPYSYYGFSAFINNINHIGVMCHFIKEEVRDHTFKNFNLQIGPISINELKNFKNLPLGYEKIINLKNKNIIDSDQNLLGQIDSIKEIIFGNQKYSDLIESNNYLD